MHLLTEFCSTHRRESATFLATSVAVFILSSAAYATAPSLFVRFLGPLNPPIVVLLASLVGALCILLLISRGWFPVLSGTERRGRFAWFILAASLGTVAIVVDRIAPFPADINILFPHSLMFYPVMGFLVEILFHLIPISILILIMPALTRTPAITIISILCVSLLEPSLQIALGLSGPKWRIAWVGLHVFIINLCQIFVFRRFDFLTMYSFRLVYYSIWHVGWGYFRLLDT